MSTGKIIWWVIIIALAIYLFHEFGFKKSDNKCCRIEEPNTADAPIYQYCKRGEKYYVTKTGGFVGGETETEISGNEFNIAWKNQNCKKS